MPFFELGLSGKIETLEQKGGTLKLCGQALAKQVDVVPASAIITLIEFLGGELVEERNLCHKYNILALLGDFGQAMIGRMCVRLWNSRTFVISSFGKRGKFWDAVQEGKKNHRLEFAELVREVNETYQADLDEDRLISILLFTHIRHTTFHANLLAATTIEALNETISSASEMCSNEWPGDLEHHRQNILWVVEKYQAIITISDASEFKSEMFKGGNYTGWIETIAKKVSTRGGICTAAHCNKESQ